MNHAGTLQSYLYALILKYRFLFIMSPILALLAALFSVLVHYQIKEIIDAIASDPTQNVTMLVVWFVLFKLAHHGFHFIIRIVGFVYNPIILADVVQDGYRKTMSHSLHWFDGHLSGEIASKITDFQESIDSLIVVSYRFLTKFFGIFIGVVFLCTVHSLVAGIVILFILVHTILLVPLLKKQIQLQSSCVNARQKTIGIINDSISNVFAIKIIGTVLAEFTRKLIPAIHQWQNWDKKVRFFDTFYVDLVDTILITLMGAVQILLLAYLYKTGQITVGEFTFIVMITLDIHRRLDDLLEDLLFTINPKIALMQSSYRFINTPSDTVNLPEARELPRVMGDIVYEAVTFGYETGRNIFENLTVHIKAGTHVGIVGTSGAGKTTLIKCLLRYFDLQDGRILVDGCDIAAVTQESLRAQISIIPQDVSLFHRTILENLQLAKPDASIEEIENACKKAKIHDDILQMPNGYQSIVGERGVKVSGGQRQRIAIARAILKNAPILILDEATSALDTPTEFLIQESINEMLETSHATTIVIAHRLSTLLHMDRILVLDHGMIVEDGTHQELLAKNGLYKQLWHAQVCGFLPPI